MRKEVGGLRLDQVKTFAKLKEKGLKQEAVSRKARISRVTMSAAFNGKSCKESTIRAIAEAMGCNLDEITAAG